MGNAGQIVVTLSVIGAGPAGAQIRGFANASNSAANTVAAASAKTAQASANIARAAGVAGKALLIGLGAGLAASAKAAIDFEDSFAGIRKTVTATEPEFQMIERSMRDLATQIPITVHELNRIGELGGQLDVATSELTSFTRTIAEIGVSTVLSTEQAAIGFARLANILDVSHDQFQNMGSTVVDLGNNFATLEDEILNFGLRIAPIGSVVGLTAANVLALATAFTSVGIPAERGGTAVQKSFAAMADAATTGGDRLEEFAKVAGVAADDFARSFSEDPAEAFLLFLEGLNEINEAGENVFQSLRKVGLSNERTVQSLLAMAANVPLLARALDTANDAWTDNIALTEEAEKRFGTLASKLQVARNRIFEARIEIGQALTPMIADLADTISLAVTAFAQLDGTTRGWIAVGMVAAAIFLLLVKRAIVLNSVMLGLTATIKSLAAPAVLGLFVLMIGRAINKAAEKERAVRSLMRAYDDLRSGIEDAVESIEKEALLEGIPTSVLQAMAKAEISIDDLVDKIHNMPDEIAPTVQKIREEFSNMFDLENVGLVLSDEHMARQKEMTEFLNLLEVRLDAVSAAQERNHAITLLQQQANAEILAQGMAEDYEAIAISLGLLEPKTRGYADAQRDMAEASRLTSAELDELRDQIEGVTNAQIAAQNDAFALIDAIGNLAQAQADYNAVGGDTFENSLALQQAWSRMVAVAARSGPDGLAALEDNLWGMFEAGAINEAQLKVMLETLAMLAPITDAATGAAASAISRFSGSVGSDLGATQQDIANTIAAMLGLDAKAVGTSRVLRMFNVVLSSSMKENMVGAIDSAIAGMKTSHTPSFANLGLDWGKITGQNFGKGVSGGGGGKSMADHVADQMAQAVREVEQGINAIAGAINAGMSSMTAIRRLRDAEEDLIRLREEQLDLPGLIAEAERELNDERERSRQITLEEQKRIEDAEEAYKRALKAYDQGVITQTDLLLAEQELNEAREDAIADSPEVIRLEEELERLRQREIDIIRDLEDAELNLHQAQLTLVSSQLALIQAGADFIAQGPAHEELFRELAKQAGLTDDQINNLISSYAELATVAHGLAPTGLTAPPLPPPPPPPKTSTSTSGTSTKTTTTTVTGSGSTGGNVFFLHRGGRVPGFAGQERWAKLLAGEWVINPEVGLPRGFPIETGSGEIHLHIQGIWDLTRPDQVNNLMDVVETRLRRRANSRT